MTIHSTFLVGIHNWIVEVTGLDPQNVFEAKQNGPDRGPGTLWATYEIMTNLTSDYVVCSSQEDADPEGPTEGELINSSSTKRRVTTVTVNMYAPNAEDLLTDLDMSTEERTPRKILSDAGCALLPGTSVRALALRSDTVWKKRAVADFTFNTFRTRTVQEENANVFDIRGKIEENETVIYTERPTGGS